MRDLQTYSMGERGGGGGGGGGGLDSELEEYWK